MHSAASIAASATGLGIGIRLASGAPPVGGGDEAAGLDDAVERRAVDHQVLDDRERRAPATARRRSRRRSSNLRMCSWHVAVPRCGPWAWPSIISEHVPQMPSRQSWSNTIASLPSAIRRSLRTSSSSRNEASSLISSIVVGLEAARRRRGRPGARSCSVRLRRALRSLVAPGLEVDDLVLELLPRGAIGAIGSPVHSHAATWAKLLVVAQRLALLGLVLGAEVPAAALLDARGRRGTSACRARRSRRRGRPSRASG